MSTITVVIPVYKTQEPLLRACIQSVINQTYTDLEIILVDDGSPDNCGSICDEYATLDPRITVIHKKNEGVSVARNIGIEKSTSKYISFVDADDWIEPETMEIAYAEAEKDEVDILQWTYIWHKEKEIIEDNALFHVEGILDKKLHDEMVLKAIIDSHPSFSCNKGFAAGAPWGKIYRRQFLIDHNLRFVPGLARSQDRIFNLNAFYAADKIKYINKRFSHYIANDTSAVVSYRPNVEEIYQIYLREIDRFYNKHKIDTPIYDDARLICICYVIQQIFKQYIFHKKSTMGFWKRYKEVRRIVHHPVYSIGIKNSKKVKYSITSKQNLVYTFLRWNLCFLSTCAMTIMSRR